VSPLILVVDDEDDFATTCARLLGREGWQVVTVRTSAAARRVLSVSPPPDLAIVDRHLPDGDGLDVLRVARAAGTPVIVVTAYAPRQTSRRSLDEGAAAFLGKPFSTQQLLQAVHDVVGTPPPASPPAS
jgi:DNA-binding response OmpR family regulator